MKTAPLRSTSTPKQQQRGQYTSSNYHTHSGVQLCKLITSNQHAQANLQIINDHLRTQKFSNPGQMLRVSNDESQNPMTPQRSKINVFSGLKPQPSNQNSDKRASQSFNVHPSLERQVYNPSASISHLTPNRVLQMNFNNENDPKLAKPRQSDDFELLIKENSNLQQTVLKYRNEAEHYRSLLSQSNRSDEERLNLGSLKDRIEKLEQVIDVQAKEIDEWKEKYQQVREDPIDEQRDLIAQLESQILVVIQENENLNNQIREQSQHIDNRNEHCSNLEQKVQMLIDENQRLSDVNEILAQHSGEALRHENETLKLKLKELERNIKIQKEEIKTWHDTFQQFEKDQEKYIQKENELFQCRIRCQELEAMLHKRGHTKSTDQREDKVTYLLEENARLNETVQSSREKLNYLVEEVLSQQLFYDEELKRFQAQKEHLKILQTRIDDMIRLRDGRSDLAPADESVLYEEFRRSQEVVHRLVCELQR